MSKQPIFSQEHVKSLFPFHLLIGADFQILQIGDLLQKLLGKDIVGANFYDFFQLKNARTKPDFQALKKAEDKLYYLNSLDDSIALKGAFYPTTAEQQLIYIGNILPIHLLSSVGNTLSLKDFPTYDSFPDFLFIQRANDRTIQELKLLNNKIKASKSFTEKVFASMIDIVIVLDTKGIINRLNESFYAVLGYQQSSVLGQPFELLLADKKSFNILSYLGQDDPEQFIHREIDLISASKTSIPFSISFSAILDEHDAIEAILCVAQDIRLRKKMEEEKTKHIKAAIKAENAIRQSEVLKKVNSELQLSQEKIKKSLDEKDILLREIHHRVKNNMQVITSMLSLQSSYLNDDKFLNVFQVSQQRINSMALIHEMLYQTDDFTKVDYEEYLTELFNSIYQSFCDLEKEVELHMQVHHKYLNLDTAIPLGLLINEILTNAFKYGICNAESNSIYITIEALEYPHFTLKIGDNGVGLPKDFNHQSSKSLGMKLIYQLARQLQGKVEIDTAQKGTHYIIRFQEIKNVF